MVSEARAQRRAARDADPVGAHRDNPMRGRVLRGGDTPASWGNLANVITVVRIFLVPVFLTMLFLEGTTTDGTVGALRFVAAGLFILAISTDFVDGSLARRRNLVTEPGKLLDPIADKLLVLGAAVALSLLGELAWWVTAILLVRELGITVWRFVALRDRVIPAGRLGKVKTWLQAIALSVALVPFWVLGESWREPHTVLSVATMTLAVVMTLVSGAEFARSALRAPRGS